MTYYQASQAMKNAVPLPHRKGEGGLCVYIFDAWFSNTVKVDGQRFYDGYNYLLI